MATSGINQHLAQFRARIRALQDKKNPSNRELLGLFFDLYEIFMVLSDDMKEELAEAVVGSMPQFKAMDEETFKKLVGGSDKKNAKTEDAKGKGQYL
jgi:hypothetical protein